MNYTNFLQTEEKVFNWMGRNGIFLLRISMGVIFVWFGFQKYFPGISSAEDLATRTIDVMSFGLVGASLSMPLLATWEVLIGLGFLIGKFMRLTIILLYLQMIGTFMPLFIFPSETFYLVPLVPSLEGQYIIKNLLIITAAMVIGAHAKGKITIKSGF